MFTKQRSHKEKLHLSRKSDDGTGEKAGITRYSPAPFLTHVLTMFFKLHYASTSPPVKWEEEGVELFGKIP